MTDWIDVSAAEEFPEGQTRLVTAGAKRIGVYNVGGRYYAMEDACSHQGFALLGSGIDAAELLDGDVILCPRHGARFCVRTGEALAPPAWEPIRTCPVRVEGGRVQVRAAEPPDP